MRRRLRPSTIPRLPTAFDAAAELDWGDPVMSRRLLREHLDQKHDGASRRIPVIERHIARLAKLIAPPPARVLDAACGPGLYAVRLARMGWDVVGVDTGEPVLRHARGLAREAGVAAEFRRADLRAFEGQGDFDAVILVYFILEAFPRREQTAVLRRLAAALRPGGRLVAELRVRPDQPPGRITAWDVVPRSLVSDRPHLLLTDTLYDERRRTFVLREIGILDDGSVAVQQTTGQLVTLAEVPALFARAGLRVRAVHDGWTRYRATGLSETLLVVAERR
ncbi:MAG: putative Trans-aconitate 2-methyltransferase [Chloroflexi bacterium]|jgi:SAM-dependent methyltransferase|nr:putative Trans-aconitate 2-methyltransferase [Chloroflexota bacterium]